MGYLKRPHLNYDIFFLYKTTWVKKLWTKTDCTALGLDFIKAGSSCGIFFNTKWLTQK